MVKKRGPKTRTEKRVDGDPRSSKTQPREGGGKGKPFQLEEDSGQSLKPKPPQPSGLVGFSIINHFHHTIISHNFYITNFAHVLPMFYPHFTKVLPTFYPRPDRGAIFFYPRFGTAEVLPTRRFYSRVVLVRVKCV